MTEVILGLFAGLLFSLLTLVAYRLGIKDGLRASKGKEPERINIPQAIKEAVIPDAKNEQTEFEKGLQNIMDYDLDRPTRVGD